MKVTFILRDKTDEFFTGFGESIRGLDNMTDPEKYSYLADNRAPMRIGTANSFRDRVDLNSILRGECHFTYKLEPRKGYKLATFEITKGH